MKSIIQKSKYCWFCGTGNNLHLHHIFGGANRKCVHQCREMDLLLKQECQREFEKTHSRDEFMEIIHKNYLD